MNSSPSSSLTTATVVCETSTMTEGTSNPGEKSCPYMIKRDTLVTEINRMCNTLTRLRTEEYSSDVSNLLKQLHAKYEDLEAAHYQCIDSLVDKSKVAKETRWYEEFQKTYLSHVGRTRKWLNNYAGASVSDISVQPVSNDASVLNDSSVSTSFTSELAARLSLPTQQVPIFDGNDVMSYKTFITIFDQVVVSNISDPQECLNRLAGYLRGDALRAVQPCVLRGSQLGYAAARKVLDERYGDIFAIAERLSLDLSSSRPVHKPQELRRLSDELNAAFTVLSGSDAYSRVNNPDFVRRIVSRCKPHVRNKWRKIGLSALESSSRIPDFGEFVKFIAKQAREACNPLFGEEAYKEASARPSRVQSTHYAADTSGAKFRCAVCGDDHGVHSCKKFSELSVNARYEVVRDKGLCFSCLRGGHRSRDCRSKRPCGVNNCDRRHHRLLHTVPSSPPVSTQSVSHTARVQAYNALGSSEDIVCLPLARVRVNDRVTALALLDPGSTVTLITKKLCKKLKIKGRNISFSLQSIHGRKTMESQVVDFKLTSLDSGSSYTVRDACVVSGAVEVPATSPNVSLNLDQFSHLEGVDVSSVTPGTRADLIIGQDNSDLLVPLEVRHGPEGGNLPFATKTRLGWTLNGRFGTGPCRPGQVYGICNHIDINTGDLSDKIDKLWQVENDFEQDVSWSVEDHKVYALWEDSTVMEDGRYVVPMPWRDGRPMLPNNRYVALKRLESTLSKLNKTGMHSRYDAGIQKYLDDGHAEVVPEGEISRNDGAVWYLPHHGVYQEEKDKLRIVHDCSATFQGVSLNKSCFRGPVLVNKLQSVLLRFRQYNYAWTADVTGMYLQVVIPLKDRDCLRFLWQRDGKIIEYRMTRHLFGGVWCASSSAYAMLRTLRDFQADMVVRDVVGRSMYVDDLLRSIPSAEELARLIPRVCEVLLKGGFPLSKHMVNVPSLLSSIPEAERAKEARVITDVLHCKALGVRWDVVLDTLKYVKGVMDCLKKLCKRGMLSCVAALYDPLGLIIPIVILGRMLFQRAVRLGLDWDDLLPPDLIADWSRWWTSLDALADLSFPRCLVPSDSDESRIELHHFCDGSLAAYGVCSYLRVICGADISVRLICARARLVPLKPLSVPRIELWAAVMAAGADEMIRREMDLVFSSSHFWSDSQVVLAYLRSESGRFKPFVANRVAEVLSKSDSDSWRYVPTELNPADVVSRGCVPSMLPDSWVAGPDFLSTSAACWTEVVLTGVRPVVDPGDVELKKTKIVNVVKKTNVSVHPFDALLARTYDYDKLLRVCAQLRRLVCKQTGASVSVHELRVSELRLIQHVQSQYYSDELVSLRSSGVVHKSSSLSSLDPRLIDGVIRVGGRLSRTRQVGLGVHPVILPGGSPLSRAILLRAHNKAHLGVEWTLGMLRGDFWIPGARNILRGIRRSCVLCQRLYGVARSQKMADLPSERVSAGEVAFDEVGVDLFGPFFVSQGRARVKRWGCLFTCLTIRAVHLELLSSMDSDSFLNAFRRFCARRGVPRLVRSDQGTNFVGAIAELRREFQNVDKAVVVSSARSMNVEWTFNPPYASHQGGVWERMIRTVRKVLIALLPQGTVSDEVLSTVFVEVENMINSRPITRVSSDGLDAQALTPNSILLMRGNLPPAWREFGKGEAMRKRWKLVQNLVGEFWRRWTAEYLPTLQTRRKWTKQNENYKDGDVVVVLDEQLKSNRGMWPLARVAEAVRGEDGLVRSLKLRFRGTEIHRPITKVAPLELE